MTGHGKIGQTWGLFMRNNPAQLLPNRVSEEIYAVYTDYESDHTGDYTFLLGYKVSSVDHLSDGLTASRIPAGEYAVFTSETGPARQVVPALWQKIWRLNHDDLQGTRAYQADFEVYDQRAANPNEAQITIFLGIVF